MVRISKHIKAMQVRQLASSLASVASDGHPWVSVFALQLRNSTANDALELELLGLLLERRLLRLLLGGLVELRLAFSLPALLLGLLVFCFLPERLPDLLLDTLLALLRELLVALLAALPLERLPPELRLALVATLLPGLLLTRPPLAELRAGLLLRVAPVPPLSPIELRTAPLPPELRGRPPPPEPLKALLL